MVQEFLEKGLGFRRVRQCGVEREFIRRVEHPCRADQFPQVFQPCLAAFAAFLFIPVLEPAPVYHQFAKFSKLAVGGCLVE